MSTAEGFLRRLLTDLLYFWALISVFPLCLSSQATHFAKPARLYIESFKTTSGADKLRRNVIAELPKSELSIVTSRAQADVILDGGGEIWVKGYQSLNPRSGRSPRAGTPVYDGYLSVELADSRGQTFWSDLVTPGSESEDVSKDLAKRIAKHVVAAMQQGEPTRYSVVPAKPATVLQAAGATFPQPIYQKWFANYRRENPNLEITYRAIGSEAGIRELLAGHVDFGASDSPEVIRDLAPDQQRAYLFFPSAIGAVVPIVNLPGVSSAISLTPEALAGIYLGQIKKWNDPLLVKSNRSLHLPDLDITVVHRSDGSGTSYAWTEFLSKTNPAWRAEVGTGLNPKWPTGKAAQGNDGIAKLVKEFGGSIGYVEFIYALQNRMSFAKVRNRNGEFVSASLASMGIAASQAARLTDNVDLSIVNAPGDGAYPIASFTWFVIPVHMSNLAKREAIKGFLHWMLESGQNQAAALGYLPLPKDILAKAQASLSTMN